jgi:hypothetical protein
MRIVTTAMGALALVVSLANLGLAEQLSQPLSVRQIAYEHDDYSTFASGEDQAKSTDAIPVAEPTEPKDAAAGCEPACSPAACDQCGPCRPCGCRDNCLGIKTGGWLQVGATGNGEDPGDGYNGPVLTNDCADKLQMNQLWLYMERPIDTQGGFDVGGRIDLLYGTDWRVADCFGNGMEDRMNGPDNLYGIALPQMYLEAGKGDLSVKMGRMAGILGYESVVPMVNFFYSHCYTLCYGEPILITGLMGDYKLSDQVHLLAGFHNGYHQFENDNGDLNFEGGVKWTSRDQMTSLAYCMDLGRNDLEALSDEYVQSIVFQRQLTHRLHYVFQSDYGYTNNVAGAEDADWYSVNQYLLYKLDSKWSGGLRIEWFRDDDGTRVMGAGNLPDAKGWMGAPGYAGNFTELTMGLNWKPRMNMTFRPEVRWDWYDGPANPNGPYPYPFDDGTSKTQFTVACDFILTF